MPTPPASNAFLQEIDAVYNRIDIIISQIGDREPAIADYLRDLKSVLPTLGSDLNRAYNTWIEYERNGETVPPHDSVLETSIEHSLSIILGSTFQAIPLFGAVAWEGLQFVLKLADVDLFRLSKDYAYSDNGGADIMFAANDRGNYDLGGGADVFLGRFATTPSNVSAGSGNDTVIGSASGDVLRGDDGNDKIYLSYAGGEADGGLGNDTLFGDSGHDRLIGGAGTDVILAGNGNDIILASFASPAEDNSETADEIIGADGNDNITGSAGNNIIFADDISSFTGDLDLGKLAAMKAAKVNAEGLNYVDRQGIGNDTVSAGKGDDYVSGGKGNDSLMGEAGKDYLFGDDGDDFISGGSEDDHLFGGVGADVLRGDAGHDVAGYWDAEEAVRVDLAEANKSTGEAEGDTFASIEEIQGSKHGDTLRAGPSTSTVKTLDGMEGNDTLFGGEGASTLKGGAGDDIFYGGLETPENLTASMDNQRDLMQGGAGADTYNIAVKLELDNPNVVYAKPHDGTVFADQSFDISKWDTCDIVEIQDLSDKLSIGLEDDNFFFDLAFSELTKGQSRYFANMDQDIYYLVQPGDDTVNEFSGGWIIIDGPDGWYLAATSLIPDSVGWTYDPIAVLDLNPTIIPDQPPRGENKSGGSGNDALGGGAGHDTLSGNAGADTLNGEDGNDEIDGGDDDDILNGGEGEDFLDGSGGADTLSGGLADDYVVGGQGDDTYVFNRGDGQDTFSEGVYGDGFDTILFGVGITADDLIVSKSPYGSDLILQIRGTDDVITASLGLMNNDYRIDQVKFADGTSLSFEQLRELALSGTSGSDSIVGDAEANSISGVAGDDTLDGAGGDDTLAGGQDNDLLFGGNGNDTYIFNLGDGQDVIEDAPFGAGGGLQDILSFGPGISSSDLVLSEANNGNDLLIQINGTPNSVTIKDAFTENRRIEFLQFSDGELIIYNDYIQLIGDPIVGGVVEGDVNDNDLAGGGGDDTVRGFAGDDTLEGGAGDDLVVGNEGDDVYVFNLGDGQDTFRDEYFGGGGFDTIEFGAGITAADLIVSQPSGANDMLIRIAGTTDQITVAYGFWADDNRIEQVRFSDGSTLSFADLRAMALTGTAATELLEGDTEANVVSGAGGDDSLIGHAGADTLTGGAGDDWVVGGEDDDTYVFNLGDGQDVVEENSHTGPGGGFDTIEFGVGVTASDLVFSAASGGNDLLVQIAGTTDQITVRDGLVGVVDRVELIRFSDGSTLTYEQILEELGPGGGTGGGDTLEGDADANVLTGGAGDDSLRGYAGADTLTGGTGDDILIGNEGDDTYIFNLGDGQDIVRDEFWGGGGFDTIQFGAGVTASDIVVRQPGGANDMLIQIAGTDDQITVLNGFWADDNRIEQLRFDDGSTLSFADLRARALSGTAANELLEGDADANAILGASGNDSLIGHAGADTMTGGVGNDWLVGGTGDDAYVFNLGDGEDLIEEDSHTGPGGGDDMIVFGAGITGADLVLTSVSGGNDLLIKISGTSDSITIKDGLVADIHRIEKFKFADGTVWDQQQISSQLDLI